MDISKDKLLFLRKLAFVTFIEMAVLAGFGYIEIGEFEKLLNEMGGTTPSLTNLYLSSYKYWSVLAIFPLFILIKTLPSQKNPTLQYRVTSFVLIAHMIFGLMIFIGTIFAMYAPIFELGNTL